MRTMPTAPGVMVLPSAVTPDNSNRCGDNKHGQYRSGIGMYYNYCRIRHPPTAADINPGWRSIVPVPRNVYILCLRRNGPVTRDPDIFPTSPPPIPINPGMVGVRLVTTVIIHWLTGRVFGRGLLRFRCRYRGFFRLRISFLPLGWIIQFSRFRRNLLSPYELRHAPRKSKQWNTGNSLDKLPACPVCCHAICLAFQAASDLFHLINLHKFIFLH